MTRSVATVIAADGAEVIVPIWQEVVLGSVAFALLCFVLMKLVFPRMEKTFTARHEAIEGGVTRAQASWAEAQHVLEQYHEAIAGARAEAARIRDGARADAERLRQAALAEAKTECERIVAEGRGELAVERQVVVEELRADAETFAVQLAGRIVG